MVARSTRLTVALWRDRACARARRVLHPWDFQRRWFRELAAFYRHLSPEEFWMNYRDLRADAARLWKTKQPTDVYAATDYYIYRQMYYHRDRCFHAINTVLPDDGTLFEYGCGVAPVTAWLYRTRPAARRFLLDDIPSRTLTYAAWRLNIKRGNVPSSHHVLADVIACLEVFEHLPKPEPVARDLVRRLKPGGYLFANFIAGEAEGGNLKTAQAQREQTIYYLTSTLETIRMITPDGQTGIYRAAR